MGGREALIQKVQLTRQFGGMKIYRLKRAKEWEGNGKKLQVQDGGAREGWQEVGMAGLDLQ